MTGCSQWGEKPKLVCTSIPSTRKNFPLLCARSPVSCSKCHPSKSFRGFLSTSKLFTLRRDSNHAKNSLFEITPSSTCEERKKICSSILIDLDRLINILPPSSHQTLNH